MKKISMVVSIMIVTLMFAGCSQDNLADYLKASELADAETSGKDYMDISAELEFNKEGLSDETLRELSYFNVIKFVMEDTYEETETGLNVESRIYYNLGGMGLDMSLYIQDDKMYMKMPVQDKYIDMSDQLSQEDGISASEDIEFNSIMEPILTTWKELLNTDDILKGQKTYIMTEEGQLKATTYLITIDEEQLAVLSEKVIEQISKEEVLEYFINQDSTGELTEADTKEIIEHIRQLLLKASIVNFEGTAFVDFDGRMIKQTFYFELDFGEGEPGDVTSIKGSFIMEKSDLGEKQTFNFPTISDDQWVYSEDGSVNYTDMFPDGLFE
ncbi:MAG: hypothetical protein PF505_04875 [Vallitaleaceae bacterium]|jgi:hypothetical protein|nr:hypothetical protein [Vallitaleaceae bacterium]